MDRERIKSIFLSLNQVEKELVLLNLMFNITIAIRDFFQGKNDAAKASAGYTASEINHKALAFIIASLSNQSRYPDDVIIDIVLDQFLGSELKSYLPQVWDASIRSVDGL